VSLNGTAGYRDPNTRATIPDLVLSATDLAEELGFAMCVRHEIGRLLAVLAGGLPPGSEVGETGTGTGAGLAWMVNTAPRSVSFISYERDQRRAAGAQRLFADYPNVEIVCGDAAELFARGPFDLLVHDGGPGSGKTPNDAPVDPTTVLKPGGTMTVDDYTPSLWWPPVFEGRSDVSRMHWLDHASLKTTEVRVAPDLAVLVSRFLPPRDSAT
jgi:predicted O-methyltransferase YrrM